MGGAGLVAFIVTLHEPSAWAGLMAGLAAVIPFALLFRKLSPRRLLTGALLLFVGVTLLANFVFAALQDVTAFDVEVVRASEPPPPPAAP